MDVAFSRKQGKVLSPVSLMLKPVIIHGLVKKPRECLVLLSKSLAHAFLSFFLFYVFI